MFKALLKKQLTETAASFLVRRNRKGKNGAAKKAGAPAGAPVGMIILFVFLFLCIAFSFVGMSELFASGFIPLGLDWLYFSMLGMIAVVLSVFGSVFSTYSGLYRAKDNDFLLSMPIKPSMILTVRMISVYAMSLIWCALVWLPAVGVYFFRAKPGALAVIFSLLLLVVLSALSTVLSCLLGWLVALIGRRLRSKTLVTVVFSVALFALYYFVYFRLNTLLSEAVENAVIIGDTIKSNVYPIYQLGMAAAGNAVPMLIVTLAVAALVILCIYLLSRSFIKIATTNKGEVKRVYKEKTAHVSSVGGTLLKKELNRFSSSAAYMLNGGLGLLLLPVVGVVALVNRDTLHMLKYALSMLGVDGIGGLVPVIAAVGVIMIASMNTISAPSLSLEGKNLWILRSSPVRGRDVLRAKLGLHVLLNLVPCISAAVMLGIAVGGDAITVAATTIVSLSFVWLSACIGLVVNVKRPSFDWTNEAVPLKQSASVFIAMFSGWIAALVMGGAYYLLLILDVIIIPWLYLLIVAVIFAAVAALLTHWLDTKGEREFDQL